MDDGQRFVIDSQPWLIGKIFAVVFLFLAIVMPAIVIAEVIVPSREATIDCDRARGTCTIGLEHEPRTIAIDAIDVAEVVRRSARRNESGSQIAVLRLRGGETVELSEGGYHDSVTNGYRSAVDGLNQFLGEKARPSFAVRYVAGDTDWSQLIPGAVFGPLGAWLFIWLWVSRRVELDRSARTIRLVVTRKFRSGSDRTFAYHDIRELRAVGWRWLSIVMVTQDGPQVLAVVPRTTTYQQHARRIVSTLRSELGVPLDVSDETRRYWALE